MQDLKQIIVALDFPDASATLRMLDLLDPGLCRVKVGKELFTRCGPELVRQIVRAGFEVFLDLKFHDIPNTVAGAVRAAAEMGVWMVNVHASGGPAMLDAARESLGSQSSTLLTAVTVLTSLSAEDLRATGVNDAPDQQVLRLATLASTSGLDGVVCSAWEIDLLRQNLPPDFLLVTPGIRPAGDVAGDQKRVETPGTAIVRGSSYLVIGRPITQASDPRAKLEQIIAEIHSKKSNLC
ncbi:MAG: orotidine-5-phosphate decarboxylase [Pseudomonadota bacterium]|jgi:orotidine-5'-phosphate decarboxylase